MDLVFQDHPDVHIGTLTFRRVPVILKFEDAPLIEVGNAEAAGWSAYFHIFHPDGTPLAVVKGSQLHLTKEGKKANLKLRHPPDVTVCELDGRTLFEVRRSGAAALRASAELYTPTGILIKTSDSAKPVIRESGGYISLGGIPGLKNALFQDCPVGIKLFKDGRFMCQVHVPISPGDDHFEIDGVGKIKATPDGPGKPQFEVLRPDGTTGKPGPHHKPAFTPNDPDFPNFPAKSGQ